MFSKKKFFADVLKIFACIIFMSLIHFHYSRSIYLFCEDYRLIIPPFFPYFSNCFVGKYSDEPNASYVHKCNDKQNKIRLSVPSRSSPPVHCFFPTAGTVYPISQNEKFYPALQCVCRDQTVVYNSSVTSHITLLRSYILDTERRRRVTLTIRGQDLRNDNVHHTSYAILFMKRIYWQCSRIATIRLQFESDYSATIATAKRKEKERSAMKLDDEAFSFDIIGQPDLDFSTCEYLGTCEYFRICIIIRKRDFFSEITCKDFI